MDVQSEIITIDSGVDGPHVAIFAGVHGNELAGVYALQNILPTLAITKGKASVVYANPPAIKENVRMQTKNLNRCFYKGNDGDTYEDERARELMALLDTCDALLDLHMFYDEDGAPFVICEQNGVEIAEKMDVEIISTGWTAAEPGATDGYMNEQGKIGICVECGPISKGSEYTEFAENTVYQFLQHFEMIQPCRDDSTIPKKYVMAKKSVHKASETFVLADGYNNFQDLAAGEVIATDGQKNYTAGENECIIFPHYGARVGEEAYIIGSVQ